MFLDEAPDERILEQRAGGRLREDGQRIQRHVSPQLEPQRPSHVGRQLGIQTGAAKRVANASYARRLAAARLADDEMATCVMPHPSRRDCDRREMNDGADDAVDGKEIEQMTTRIDALQRRLFRLCRGQKPPRHSVHRGHNRRRVAEQWKDFRRDVGKPHRFDGDDDQVLFAERARIVAHGDGYRRRGPVLVDLKAARTDASERLAAGER